MARIAGVDLPRNKQIEIALTYIHGIGRSRAREICGKASVEVTTKTDHLGEGEVIKIREIIEREYRVEGDLREVLVRAAESARSGDVLLLSPACSSFDMFDSYEERGRAFTSLAREAA